MTDTKPWLARPLTWEEMSPEQRASVRPDRRRPDVPKAMHKYSPFAFFNSEVAPSPQDKASMSDDPEELAAWLSDVSNDPVKFVETAFEWGNGELANSIGPEPWQRWLLEQIRDGLKTPGEAIKIAFAVVTALANLPFVMGRALGGFNFS